jgi:hypothetical protein
MCEKEDGLSVPQEYGHGSRVAFGNQLRMMFYTEQPLKVLSVYFGKSKLTINWKT